MSTFTLTLMKSFMKKPSSEPEESYLFSQELPRGSCGQSCDDKGPPSSSERNFAIVLTAAALSETLHQISEENILQIYLICNYIICKVRR